MLKTLHEIELTTTPNMQVIRDIFRNQSMEPYPVLRS